MKIVKIVKGIIAFLIILGFYMIVKHSYFGVVDENGNKITNMQEILLMEQENNTLQNDVVVNEEEKTDDIPVSASDENIQEKTEEKIQEKTEEKTQSTTKTQKNSNNQQSTTKTTTQENNPTTSNNNKTETANQPKMQETPKAEIPKTETYTETEVQVAEKKECIGNNHSIGAGNTGKWFNTKAEAESYYDKDIAKWGTMWENDEITKEEYLKKCPSGYETWTCPICQKWTLNYYYR